MNKRLYILCSGWVIHVGEIKRMDLDLYDEFGIRFVTLIMKGNYIGPEIEEESGGEEVPVEEDLAKPGSTSLMQLDGHIKLKI